MAALTGPRTNGKTRSTGYETAPVKGATTIWAGSLVCLDANGYAVPGSLIGTLTVLGIAEETVINTGADGAKSVTVRTSAGEVDHFLLNDATNPCTIAHVGKTVYVMDDQTLRSLATGASVAGTCMGVTAAGVWLRLPL